jgi:hypothetical protein
MPTILNSPFRSTGGFKSPSFTVDAVGNITARSITLEVSDETEVAADNTITEVGGNFRLDAGGSDNPGFVLFRATQKTIDITLSSITFSIFSNVTGTPTLYNDGLRHSDGTTGLEAQGKNSGRLFISLSTSAPNLLYYGNSDGTIYGTITVQDPQGLFSNASITGSTNSTSTTTGALKVTGGVGIGLNAYIGGTLNVASMITATGGVTGDLSGSVYSDSSTLLVDSVAGQVVGPINNSTIDNTTIGTTTPSTAAFTTATLSGAVIGTTAVPNKKYVDETSTAFAIAFGI